MAWLLIGMATVLIIGTGYGLTLMTIWAIGNA